MLYPTLNQPLVFFIIFLVGLASGFFFDIANILSFLSKDKFAKIFFDFLAVIFSFFALFYSNLAVNYGQFRVYILFVFLFALILQRFLSKILWTKCIKGGIITSKRRKMPGKKKKIINISIIVGLIVLIAFVVVTSIVINYQKEKRDRLEQDNEHISDILDDEQDLPPQDENLLSFY